MENDAFNIFREQANNLREAPSSDAWERLEQRLEKQQPRDTHAARYKTKLFANTTLWAAGLSLLLMGCLATLGIAINMHHQRTIAAAAPTLDETIQMQQLTWLVGKWQSVSEGNFAEEWTFDSNKVLNCKGKSPLSAYRRVISLKNNTVFFEKMTSDATMSSAYPFKYGYRAKGRVWVFEKGNTQIILEKYTDLAYSILIIRSGKEIESREFKREK
jgi:hypothetical protein